MSQDSANSISIVDRFRLAFWATLTGLLLAVSASLFFAHLQGGLGAGLEIPGVDYRLGPMTSGAILAVLSFGAAMKTIPSARKVLLRTRAEIRNAASEKFPVVIFALSITAPETLAKAGTYIDERPTKTLADKLNAFEALCQKDGEWGRWNWQQPLRLLAHNHERLKCAYVITTRESWPYFAEFRQLVARLLPDGAQLRGVEKTAERDDYNELTDALNWAIEDARKEFGVAYPQICIDTTSGTGVYSAAATVKALNSDIMLSYFGSFGGENEGKQMVFRPLIKS